MTAGASSGSASSSSTSSSSSSSSSSSGSRGGIVLPVTERKELRGREAKEAVADHEAAQQAFHEKRERLQEERLARGGRGADAPTLELPDDTPIENVRFSTRIKNAVTAAEWKAVGEIREASDATLLGLQDLGPGLVTSLRETLGLPSCDGVRPLSKEPA